MRTGLLLAATLLGTPTLALAGRAPLAAPRLTQPPATVQAVPITETSKPFITVQRDLDPLGYVWEEYFLSGQARAYEWTEKGLGVKPISERIPYTTRLLVLRPVKARRFSGNVVVEPLNATRGFDSSADLSGMTDSIIRRGDVWIGVTSKAVSINALKRFDPARYAPLSWGTPIPAAQRCARPSIIPEFMSGPPRPGAAPRPLFSFPESEDGLIWDIYAQLGLLLKGPGRGAILPAFAEPTLFSTGTSQSGILQRTYFNAFHRTMRTPEGGPIYDAYLVDVGPALMRINQCSQDVLPEDARSRAPAIDAAVFNLYSEGELWLGGRTRQPDVIGARTGHVTYEVAGAAHGGGLPSAAPAPPIPAPAANAPPVPSAVNPLPAGITPNQFPRAYLTNAALKNLEDWVTLGRRPPAGARIAMRGTEVVRDTDGNALGGVRSVWIDVPTASYKGALGTGGLAIVGGMTPLAPARLKALYPTKEDYLAKVRARVTRAVAERWLLPEDADGAIASAAKGYAP